MASLTTRDHGAALRLYASAAASPRIRLEVSPEAATASLTHGNARVTLGRLRDGTSAVLRQ